MAFDDDSDQVPLGTTGGEIEPAPAEKALLPSYAPMTELPADLAQKRTETQRERVKSLDELSTRTESRLEEGRSRIKQAFDQTGVGPGELPSWDHEKQSAKYRTDPVESFGSFASLFAMVAATFTRAPMENALNGAAAAMTAIKEGNDKEFDRSFDAWKTNTDLALKRHNIMQQSYQNAINLQSVDINQSRTQMQMLAAKYDDKQLLFLMENGMDKEALELLDKRNKAALDAERAGQEITKSSLQRELLDRDPEFNNEDPDAYKRAGRKLKAYNNIYGEKLPPVQAIMAQFKFENPGANAKAVAEFHDRYFGHVFNAEQAQVQQIVSDPDISEEDKFKRLSEIVKRKGPAPAREGSEAAFIQKRKPELMADGTMSETEAELAAAAEWKKAHTAERRGPQEGTQTDFIQKRTRELMDEDPILTETNAQLKAAHEWKEAHRAKPLLAQEIERRAAELEAGGTSKTEAFDKASQEVRRASQVPTANRVVQMQNRKNAIELSRYTMDKAETILNKHWGITGLGGVITRPMESAGNITSISDETDRAQFRRYIEELKEWGPTVLLDRSGRPLSSEASRMDSIIAGIKLGDTAANTKRAFSELRKLWDIIERQVGEQMGEPKKEVPPPTGGDWWQKLKDRPKE